MRKADVTDKPPTAEKYSRAPAQLRWNDDFIKSHYELVAEHATRLSASRWRYVQLSLFGVSVFYAALFNSAMSLNRSNALTWIIWAPVALAFFGGLQTLAIGQAIRRRNRVLLRIERRFRFAGWAHDVGRRKLLSICDNPFDSLVIGYWIFLLIVTILFGVETVTGHFHFIPEKAV